MSAKSNANSEPQTGIEALRSLTQQEASELIDKPTKWLRDNANIGCRNADMTYDGPALVQAILVRSDMVDLTDPELVRRKQEAEVLQIEARAKQAQMNLEEMEAEHIPIEDVRFIMETVVDAYGEALSAQPENLEPKLPEDVAKKLIPVIKRDNEMTLIGITETLQRRLFPEDALP